MTKHGGISKVLTKGRNMKKTVLFIGPHGLIRNGQQEIYYKQWSAMQSACPMQANAKRVDFAEVVLAGDEIANAVVSIVHIPDAQLLAPQIKELEAMLVGKDAKVIHIYPRNVEYQKRFSVCEVGKVPIARCYPYETIEQMEEILQKILEEIFEDKNDVQQTLMAG
jgi:hypothetical protein